MAFSNHEGCDIDLLDAPSQLKQYMFIKSSLNGYCLTAYADPPGTATYKVLNSPQTNELLDFQVWCVQMYDGGKFTIASKAAPQQMMSSGSGLQSQLLRLETNSSPAPPSQLLWTYDAQTGAGNDGGFIKATLLPGNVLDIVGSISSEEAQVQLCAQNGGRNQRFSFEPIQSYIQITGSDLVFEVDSNNVICNTKIASNNNQLWKLMYTWTDKTFQILLATSQQLKMTYRNGDSGLSEVVVSDSSTNNLWKGDGNNVCTPNNNYLATNGNTVAGSQVLLYEPRVQPHLQLEIVPQM